MQGSTRGPLALARVLAVVGLLFLLWTFLSSFTTAPVKRKEFFKDDEIQVEKNEPAEPKKCPDTYYTAADVMSHHTCNYGKGDFDLWLVIVDHVYDVTKWAPHHPGGSMICNGVGVDATVMFTSNHHDYVMKDDLPKWCIGRITPEEILKLKKN